MVYLSFVLCFALGKRYYKKRNGNQKIANQLKFEERKQLKYEVDLIINSMVFAKEAIDSGPSELYYLIHWKRKMYVKDT